MPIKSIFSFCYVTTSCNSYVQTLIKIFPLRANGFLYQDSEAPFSTFPLSSCLSWFGSQSCHGTGQILSVVNQRGDLGLVLFVGRKTRAQFYLCTWRPGLGSICGHGNQGLVLFVPPGDIQLVLNKRPKPLSACSSYAILFLKIPRLFCRVLKSLVQCGNAEVEWNSRAEM